MNVCLCLFFPCSCELGEIVPGRELRSGPSVRKCSAPVLPKVAQDGGGAAGAERRRAVRTS